MKLINFKNYNIEISDEALLVKPIRDLYNKDTSPNKEDFIIQCSIIFFMVDPRSSYTYIIDLKERFEEIKKQEGLPKTYKISKELQRAMDAYAELSKTSASRLLESANAAIAKISEFLNKVDLFEEDEKGRPKYTVSNITAATKMLPQLAKDITETEKIVTKELEEASRMRGGDKNKSVYEDGVF